MRTHIHILFPGYGFVPFVACQLKDWSARWLLQATIRSGLQFCFSCCCCNLAFSLLAVLANSSSRRWCWLATLQCRKTGLKSRLNACLSLLTALGLCVCCSLCACVWCVCVCVNSQWNVLKCLKLFATTVARLLRCMQLGSQQITNRNSTEKPLTAPQVRIEAKAEDCMPYPRGWEGNSIYYVYIVLYQLILCKLSCFIVDNWGVSLAIVRRLLGLISFVGWGNLQ